MAETGQDDVIYAGNDVSLDFTLCEADGSPINLAGATLLWGMTVLTADEAILTKSSGNAGEIIITDAMGGLASVILVPADTSDLETCGYRQELGITDSGGKIETLATGRITLRKSILY